MPIQAPQWTEYLSCPICYNEFKDQIRQPVSLGCGHTLCKSCLAQLHRTQCPFDQASVNVDINELPINTALLQLVGADISSNKLPNIQCIKDNAIEYCESKRYIEELALFLKPLTSSGSNENLKMNSGAASSNVLTRPMQRKLVTLVNCQLAEEEGRMKAMRAARSLGERTVTELILLHQNQQTLSTNLWSAVRNRGCQFLGPAMQEEALHYILLALEGGEALSRKVLVLFVVQRLETNFPQASKTSIGHVVQLLYRASCFKVTKRDDDSSLMQLKENFRTLEALRKEHDTQIVQIATEAGLRISPDQWSSLLYGDLEHKSHMQSIIDKLQSPASFATSIQELIIALQRSGDPGHLTQLRADFNLLSTIDSSPEAVNPTWQELKDAMRAVHAVVHGLVEFQKIYGSRMKGTNEPQQQAHSSKFKTSLCRDFQRGSCPRGSGCTFAHSDDEMKRYARKKEGMKSVIPRGQPSTSGVGGEQYPQGGPAGTVEAQSLTESGGQNSNGIIKSGSPPLCDQTQGVEIANGYRTQHPVPVRQRRDIVSQMSKISIQQPMYSESGGYGPPPAHYERMPFSPTAPQNGLFRYYGQSTPVTMSNASYSNVTARTEMKPGMLSPRNSPQAVQDENLSCSRESPVTNGHLDPSVHRRRSYQSEIPCQRRDLGTHIQPPPSPAPYSYPNPYSGINYAPYDVHCRSSAEMFHTPYGGARYETSNHQGPVLAGYTAYRPDMAPGDYYSMTQYFPAYVPDRMISRKPYIPDENKLTDCSMRTSNEVTDSVKLDGCNSSLTNFAELLSDFKSNRKDTGPSSSSSGVSSASPLSHSPAASHSSGSSLSPRGSPVTWLSGSDGDFILSQMYSSSADNGKLPPPTTIWSSSQANGTGWPSNLGLLIPAYHSEQEKLRHLSESDMRDRMKVTGNCSMEQTDRAIARTLQTCYDEEFAGQIQCKNNELERREALDRNKKEQEKTDLEIASGLQLLEDKEELERQKREEHKRLFIERKIQLEKQKREKQERMDRELAERIAFEEHNQAVLVRPEPMRCPLPIGYNPDVMSRGRPVNSYCHHTEPDGLGSNAVTTITGFGSFSGFSTCCGSSLGKDEEIDVPKLGQGSSADIRVQE